MTKGHSKVAKPSHGNKTADNPALKARAPSYHLGPDVSWRSCPLVSQTYRASCSTLHFKPKSKALSEWMLGSAPSWALFAVAHAAST